jgi:hypothetical protein
MAIPNLTTARHPNSTAFDTMADTAKAEPFIRVIVSSKLQSRSAGRPSPAAGTWELCLFYRALVNSFDNRNSMRLNFLKSRERGQCQQKTSSIPFAHTVVG